MKYLLVRRDENGAQTDVENFESFDDMQIGVNSIYCSYETGAIFNPDRTSLEQDVLELTEQSFFGNPRIQIFTHIDEVTRTKRYFDVILMLE